MPDEFVIHWEVDNVSRLTAEGCRSPIYHHANLPWSLFVDKETSERTEFVPHLGLYLGCNNDDENDCNLWSCERKSTLSLLHRTAPEKSIHATHDVAFRKGVTDWGRNRFIAFESLLNPAEGFIEDDKIIVEARITVIATHHVRQMTIIDFSQPSPDADNVPVKFDDDGILYVCLRMLMWHSTFFASLIMNIEKDKLIKEITVKGVRTRDFTELLHVIFPSERPINVDSYWPVLRLAHLFGIERALDQVEMFLVKTKRVQTATKLLLAEQFKLERLMKYCLKSFETLTEMKDLENTTEFSKMSIALKASLLAKAFELIYSSFNTYLSPTFEISKMSEDLVIRWEIEEIGKLTNDSRYSPFHHHRNIPWRLSACTDNENSNRTGNVNFFGLFLKCNEEDHDDLWNILVSWSFVILNRNDPEKTRRREYTAIFSKAEEYHWGKNNFIEFSTLLKWQEGFVQDDKLVVEARILIKESSCVNRQSSALEFTQPISDADDIVQKFDNGTLHSCRRYLMWHSPYFASLFLQDMNKNEFEIEAVKTEDFAELLHVIFPSERPINADSYKIILALAERFQIEIHFRSALQYALDLAEKFLINTENVKMSTKLLLADEFKLESLKKYCLTSFKTPKGIKSLETSTDFPNMSSSLKASLLAKLFELIQ